MDRQAEVVNLLMIVDKARQWPALQLLHDMAMQRLQALQAEMAQATRPDERWHLGSASWENWKGDHHAA